MSVRLADTVDTDTHIPRTTDQGRTDFHAAARCSPGTADDLPGAVDRVPHDLFIAGEWQAGCRCPDACDQPGDRRCHRRGRRRHRGRRPTCPARRSRRPGGLGAPRPPGPARRSSTGPTSSWSNAPSCWREVMTLEMGKPLPEARGEVAYAADLIRWFAEEAVRIDGGYMHRPDGAARNLLLKQPVGPCLLDRPVELPARHGGPQDRARDRRRVHQHPQARPADPAVLPRARAVVQRSRPAGRGAQRPAHQPRGRDRAADARQRRDPQALLHRLHRGRQAPARPGRAGTSSARRWSSVGTLRSWCSTTPTSTSRSMRPSPRRCATWARPAPRPTGSSCTPTWPTSSRPAWANAWAH